MYRESDASAGLSIRYLSSRSRMTTFLLWLRCPRLLIVAITSTMSIFVTSASAEDNAFSENREGRFTAEISTDGSSVQEHSAGMMKSVTVAVEWWGLMGQPVYSYGFKWVPSQAIQLPDGRRLSRSNIAPYPDLQSRFDQLRPTQVTVSFDISVESKDDFQKPTHFVAINYEGGKAQGTVTTDSLSAGSPGKMTTELSPGSPRRWRDFVNWWGDGGDSPDLSAQHTFQDAARIYFSNLRIISMRAPTTAAGVILDEFERREANVNRQEGGEDFWTGEAETAFDATSDGNDEFWEGGEKTRKDFWAGDGGASDEIAVEKAIADASGHQFLGSRETMGNTVVVRFRDHGQVDGDRVRIYRNGLIVDGNLLLKGGYQEKNVPLATGTNRISFEALNTGDLGENTASFSVFDNNGKELYSEEWSISSGYKATLIVIRGR